MKPKRWAGIRRFSPWIYATLVLAVLGASPLAADTECGDNCTIKVNGLSGKVDERFRVVRPGKLVTVIVCPADLIDYEYTIEPTQQEVLQENFSIVGEPPTFKFPSVAKEAAAVKPPPPPPLEALGLKEKDNDPDWLSLQAFRTLRADLDTARKAVNALTGDVSATASSLFASDPKGCEGWPANLIKQVTSFTSEYPGHAVELEDLNDRAKNLLRGLDDRDLRDKLANPAIKPSPFRTDLRQAIEDLQATIKELEDNLAAASKMVDRWKEVMAAHPEPRLEQTFLMAPVSARYTISVQRKPITPEGLKSEPPSVGTDLTKIEASTIASVRFEDRALYRFNLSLGMAGVWRGDNREFTAAPSLDSDNNVTYHVRESNHDSTKVEGAAFLGIYIGKGVDNFNPTRSIAPMVMIGTEISASPSEFFVGLGVDFPSGVVLGAGLTEYQSVSLGKGWKVGQVVPFKTDSNGKPTTDLVVSTIPTVKKNAVGAYLFLGFRPSIFRAFLAARKPG